MRITLIVVFFLVEGRVSYLMHGLLPFKSMVTGSYFGEQEIMEKTKRKYTMRSERNCDLLTLTKAIFSTVIGEEYNDIYQEMQELAEERKAKLQEAKGMMRKYLLTNKAKLIEEGQMTEFDIGRYLDTSESESEEEKPREERKSGLSSDSDPDDDIDCSDEEEKPAEKSEDVSRDWGNRSSSKFVVAKKEQQSGEVSGM